VVELISYELVVQVACVDWDIVLWHTAVVRVVDVSS
jgi:hypothetical protein